MDKLWAVVPFSMLLCCALPLSSWFCPCPAVAPMLFHETSPQGSQHKISDDFCTFGTFGTFGVFCGRLRAFAGQWSIRTLSS